MDLLINLLVYLSLVCIIDLMTTMHHNNDFSQFVASELYILAWFIVSDTE